MKDNIIEIAKQELKILIDSQTSIERLRKEVVKKYLDNPANKALTKYIIYLMGENCKYYDFLNEKKAMQHSEHMGVSAGYYVEEMVFDILREVTSFQFHGMFDVCLQKHLIGNKNKKQDIVIQKNSKSIIAIEIKGFMGDNNCEKMQKDKTKIERAGKILYFGYSPYIYGKNKNGQPKTNEARRNGWLFCGEIEPLIDKIIYILSNYHA